MRPLRLLQGGLWALLALCLVLRLAAWLLAPALPVIVVLLIIAIGMQLIFLGRK